MARSSIIVGVMVLAVYTCLSVQYAAVWQDELTLWTAAMRQAPNKPRPHVLLAVALMEHRRFGDATSVLDDLEWILKNRNDIPYWDRLDAEAALTQNRLLLARLSGAK